MKKKYRIGIINGPNLNLLGKREPETYGSESLSDIMTAIRDEFPDAEFVDFQSNSEGEIIDTLHSWGFDPGIAGIIINPGAYAHYSFAIADALAAIPAMAVEVHISNIFAREDFRHNCVTARSARGVISGMGCDGYRLAADFIIRNSISKE